MLNIQSPHFSSSTQIDLASRLSPCFRNKRIPSTQDNYVCHWNRVNSCKKFDSPSKFSQKNRKRSHNSQHRMKNKVNLSHNIVQQINTLKNQYNNIKTVYQDLIQNKVKNDQEISKYKMQNKKYKEDFQRMTKQNQKLKSKVTFLEMQIERIKKESLKLLEIEQFKICKLEENLLEKQKAISSIMQSFKLDSSVSAIILPTTTQSQQQKIRIVNNGGSIHHLESLTFSHEKTMTNSQLISISLTSMMENQSQVRQDLSTKRHNASCMDAQKVVVTNTNNDISIIDYTETPNICNNKQNQAKPVDNFKKLRKQITKKIQVNIEQRNKQPLHIHNHNHNLTNSKSQLDRKTSKSNKASKAKLKRDDDCSQHRSSKKKIMHK